MVSDGFAKMVTFKDEVCQALLGGGGGGIYAGHYGTTLAIVWVKEHGYHYLACISLQTNVTLSGGPH